MAGGNEGEAKRHTLWKNLQSVIFPAAGIYAVDVISKGL
jgi:hypothetical protein